MFDNNINPPSHHVAYDTTNSDDISNASDFGGANILQTMMKS